MCGAVCPTGAISIRLNADGFYRPYINAEKCVDCGLCVKSCYKFDNEIKRTDSFEGKQLYGACAKDVAVIKETTSGGIADIMARRLVSQGYICIGVAYDGKTNRAVGHTAESVADTMRFRGSKYIQSLSVDTFKELVKNHKRAKYAVFGLPCQIYAIDRYLRSTGMRENHILVDLYCHGAPSLHIWEKYIGETLDRVDGKSVISANFRSKIRGWGNFYVVVVVEGVKRPLTVVSPRINDPFFTLFFSDQVLNDSCSDCSLRSSLEYTDIRLGDFWGKSYVMNHSGMSAVTVCSDSGRRLFNDIAGEMSFTEHTFDEFLPYQSYGKKYTPDETLRRELLSQLSMPDVPLKLTVDTYLKSLSVKAKLIYSLKNLVKLLPNGLISVAKKITY